MPGVRKTISRQRERKERQRQARSTNTRDNLAERSVKEVAFGLGLLNKKYEVIPFKESNVQYMLVLSDIFKDSPMDRRHVYRILCRSVWISDKRAQIERTHVPESTPIWDPILFKDETWKHPKTKLTHRTTPQTYGYYNSSTYKPSTNEPSANQMKIYPGIKAIEMGINRRRDLHGSWEYAKCQQWFVDKYPQIAKNIGFIDASEIKDFNPNQVKPTYVNRERGGNRRKTKKKRKSKKKR